MEGLLPLLIFILIPVLRGLNNSKKQKQQYQQRRRNVQTLPSQNNKPLSSNPLKSILGELNSEMKKEFFGVGKEIEKNETHKTEQRINNYNKVQEEKNINTRSKSYQESKIKPKDFEKDKTINSFKEEQIRKVLKKKDIKNNFLEFSRNPLVQGIIFSEILGPPKSRR